MPNSMSHSRPAASRARAIDNAFFVMYDFKKAIAVIRFIISCGLPVGLDTGLSGSDRVLRPGSGHQWLYRVMQVDCQAYDARAYGHRKGVIALVLVVSQDERLEDTFLQVYFSPEGDRMARQRLTKGNSKASVTRVGRLADVGMTSTMKDRIVLSKKQPNGGGERRSVIIICRLSGGCPNRREGLRTASTVKDPLSIPTTTYSMGYYRTKSCGLIKRESGCR
ncbi:hypothetical protein LshimejAT787_0300530 [Lyophyllum shimeji]|uniref:Uncharacterized protein n=1 Tax=Lyophyllum shimeji TaxID=47721 RepID=A0A9P3PGY5_LYOSH|nr:hypothetical protein LshimejAT787_0300530 [Lyophyllum shimeji]